MNSQDLRLSIIDAAVRGLLSSNSTFDRPYSPVGNDGKPVLGIFKRDGRFFEKIKNSIVDVTDEIPYEPPENWRLFRIKTLFDIYTGDSIPAPVKEARYSGVPKERGLPYIGTKDVGFDHIVDYENGIVIPFADAKSFRIAEKDCVLLCIEGGSAGKKIAVLDRKCCFGNKLMCFRPIYDQIPWLYYYLQSPTFTSLFKSSLTGIISGISKKNLESLIIAIPPVDEQKALIHKLSLLKPLLDQYEMLNEQKKNLDSEIRTLMRLSIYKAAIDGILCKHDPICINASEVRNIALKERAAAVKLHHLRKESFPAIDESDVSHYGVLPSNWAAVSLGDVVIFAHRGKTPSYVPMSEYMTLSQQNNTSNGIRMIKPKYVDPQTVQEYDWSRVLLPGDIVMNSTGGGTVGRPNVVRETDLKGIKALLPDTHVTIIRPCSRVLSDYLLIFLKNPVIQLNMESDRCKGSTNQMELAPDTIKSWYLPLPPLEEQARIVQTVRSLEASLELLPE